MNKTKENGITLIALVVTIVVLLILAGITITYVMSGEGVFKNAQDAATKTIEGQIQDYASQLQAAVMMDNAVAVGTGVTGKYNGSNIEAKTASDFFPSDLYKVEETDPEKKLTIADGKITGSLKVTALKQGEKVFYVTYKDGVVTVDTTAPVSE